ncbi:polar amino acid transport system substrate-binding protein [Desulfonatronum thiosulfatophilum]|uniref:Polar amino acid transport system substrate-binding protein n=1 Tax=Desulfonatronum thiosulfatophilum TaxID=617002 RepID=A0A1G6DZ39_9BACT|nr:transporter substrate-binding domain-containing protein [Desulfonatronum thiosulfatophilum]SDB50424.1 polar amino acid transport system substrate-binding protein [Desulfonatronum thiosulfatophilum]
MKICRNLLRTALMAALLLCIAVTAQARNITQELTRESALTRIMERGALRVGFDTFVPWAMQDKTGEFIGFEIDVARRFAEDLGVRVELVPTAWRGIIPALMTGKFDLLIGGMSIRADRAQQVYFSMPYYFTGQSLVAHRDKAAGFTTLEDFNNSGVIIVARTGTTAQRAAETFFPDAQRKYFEKEPQAVQELLMGRAHALIGNAPLPSQEAIKNPDRLFQPIPENLTREPVGIAMRKGDPDMLNYVNSWILQITGEGWIQERYKFWFETMDWKDQVE